MWNRCIFSPLFMKDKCSLVLQARTGSSRLPQKTVLPFYNNSSILELQIQRILTVFQPSDVIIATTTIIDDDEIEAIANMLGVNCFRGNEENVLNRFILCAKEFELTSLIRVCTDNVFLDIDKLKFLFETAKSDFDYISFKVDNTPSILTHFGLWTEWVRTSALTKVTELTDKPLYLEHVTNFIYNHPEEFAIDFFPLDLNEIKNVRLTTDTLLDFEIHQEMFADLHQLYGLNFTTKHIFGYLNEKPNLKSIMEQQIKENEK